jgi:hypothetical protein
VTSDPEERLPLIEGFKRYLPANITERIIKVATGDQEELKSLIQDKFILKEFNMDYPNWDMYKKTDYSFKNAKDNPIINIHKVIDEFNAIQEGFISLGGEASKICELLEKDIKKEEMKKYLPIFDGFYGILFKNNDNITKFFKTNFDKAFKNDTSEMFSVIIELFSKSRV